MYKLKKRNINNDLHIFNSPANGKSVVENKRGTVIDNVSMCPYVSGLVFWLDGINTGSELDTEWQDLINNVKFTNYSSDTPVVKNSNHFYFPSGSSMISTATLNFPYTTHTIEIVYEKTDSTSGTLFIPNTDDTVAFGITDSTDSIAAAVKTGAYDFTLNAASLKTGVHTVSFVYNGNVMHNGTDDVTWNDDSLDYSWDIDSNGSVLGMCPDSENYPFTGKIYSIRVYNRKLTKREMYHNQMIDIARFGLNIPKPEFKGKIWFEKVETDDIGELYTRKWDGSAVDASYTGKTVTYYIPNITVTAGVSSNFNFYVNWKNLNVNHRNYLSNQGITASLRPNINVELLNDKDDNFEISPTHIDINFAESGTDDLTFTVKNNTVAGQYRPTLKFLYPGCEPEYLVFDINVADLNGETNANEDVVE